MNVTFARHITQLDKEIELEGKMEKAWERFDYLSDEYYRQIGNRSLPQTITIVDISQAEHRAIEAQQAYFRHVYETGDCECTPISDACRVCRAQHKMKSTYREQI